MPDNPFQSVVLYDSLSTFEQGMDSGLAPLLLPKNQLAMATNSTVRGTFIGPRSSIRKIALQLGATDPTVFGAPNIFQGAGFYKPDTGSEQLALVLNGRFFTLTPSGTTPTATVAEIPVPGGPNPATQPQAWLWQAEKWLIWNDGVSNPLFFDGTTLTRSTFGAYVQFNVAVQTAFIIPAVGSIVNVEFTGVANMNVGDVLTFKNIGQGIVAQLTGGNFADIYNQSMFPVGQKVLATTLVTWQHSTSKQLPPGRMGVYGMGRNWFSLTDGRQFVGSDIVGGASGTQAQNFRDAVLNITENTYLAGGGNFSVPGSVGDIRAMIFTATLDTSLGQGALLVVTPSITFSCNAPVDRLTWQDITNPILTESMIANGGLGQWSTIGVNSDTIMRAVDGIRSLTLARRDFNTWGNTPISFEMSRILPNDDNTLLKYGSAVFFDNRMIMTTGPQATDRGVIHRGLVVMNCDPVSSLRGKAPSVWDGLWTGLDVLQLVYGEFGLKERCFAFVLNRINGQFELWEIQTSVDAEFDQIDGQNVPITWSFESPLIFKPEDDRKPTPLRLKDGEFFIDDLVGRASFQVFYRPDSAACWVPWKTFAVCNDPASPNMAYRARVGLGEPPFACEVANNKPYNEAFWWQVKVVVTGSCSIKKMRFKACTIPEIEFAPPAGCCDGDAIQ